MVFPGFSYTDTAEKMVIEVDASLWRSHYDWFWPDEGWGGPTFCSSHSQEMQGWHTCRSADESTQWAANRVTLSGWYCLAIQSFICFACDDAVTQPFVICGVLKRKQSIPLHSAWDGELVQLEGISINTYSHTHTHAHRRTNIQSWGAGP